MEKRQIIDEKNKALYHQIYKKKNYSHEVAASLNEVLELATDEGYKNGEDLAIILMAANEMGIGNYDKGLKLLEQIHEASIEEYSTDFIRMNYYNAYMKYYGEHMANDDLAMHYSKKELMAAEATGIMDEIMRAKMNNAYLYGRSGFHETAVDMYNAIIEYGLSMNENRLLSYVYINLADEYFKVGQLDQSEAYFMKALKYAEEMDIALLQDIILFSLSKVATEKGEYTKGISLLEKAQALDVTSYRVQDVFRRGHEFIKIYQKTNRYDDAKLVIQDLNHKLPQLENIKVKIEYYKLISNFYSEINQYEEAYKALKIFTELVEDFDSDKLENEISKMIHEDYKKELARLDTLAIIGRELTMMTDIDEMLLKLRREFSDYLPADTMGVGLLKDEALHFEHYFHDDRKILTRVTSVNSQVSLAAWSIRNKKDLVLNNLRQEYSRYVPRIGVLDEESDDEIKSAMFGVLNVGEEILGVFTVQSKNEYAYSSVESKVFRIICDYLAIAVHNAEQRHALKKLSVVDKLTNLLNRRGALDFYDHKVTNSKSKAQSVAIIMLDLDYFKRINDTYGHTVGDEALKLVATVLRSIEENHIAAARLGGEEFSIIVINQSKDEVVRLAENIRNMIERISLFHFGEEIKLTTSIGVVFKEGDHEFNYNNLYFEADKALYLAKANGRNRVEYSEGE